jgi:membrane carboxypeptidase/penicillin-binding protein PbpC
VTATPAIGYWLTQLYYTNGGTHPINQTTKTFAMPAGATTVTAVFVKINYSLSVPAGITNGTVTVKVNGGTAETSTTALYGDTITVTAAPVNGDYRLKAGTLVHAGTGVNVPITGPTFTMPAANLTVTAQFQQIPTLAITFTGYGGDETVILDALEDAALSKAAEDTITVTVSGSGISSALSWWRDGKQIAGNQLVKEFSAVELTNGKHSVTVIVEQGGAYYSKEVQFKVEE